MSISTKTRKILWARSGNQCAKCKASLIQGVSDLNSDTIVGDECHIVSGAKGGPRWNMTVDPEKIDLIDNLLLLCKVCHKLVDDQVDVFTVDALKLIKRKHEKSIEERASKSADEVKIVRSRAEIPKQLEIIRSAQDILNLMASCHGMYHRIPDDLSESELDLVGAFLQEMSDWGDVGLGVLSSPSEWISAQKHVTRQLSELNQSGFDVYVGREKQQLLGGAQPPTAWHMLHLQIKRRDESSQTSP